MCYNILVEIIQKDRKNKMKKEIKKDELIKTKDNIDNDIGEVWYVNEHGNAICLDSISECNKLLMAKKEKTTLKTKGK